MVKSISYIPQRRVLLLSCLLRVSMRIIKPIVVQECGGTLNIYTSGPRHCRRYTAKRVIPSAFPSTGNRRFSLELPLAVVSVRGRQVTAGRGKRIGVWWIGSCSASASALHRGLRPSLYQPREEESAIPNRNESKEEITEFFSVLLFGDTGSCCVFLTEIFPHVVTSIG